MATTPAAEMVEHLTRTLAARDAENRTLIARQAASNEVLRAISASPEDPQPVFELIARHARVLCDAQAVVVLEYDGAHLDIRAIEGYDPAAAAGLRQAFPRPAGPESIVGRSILAGHAVRIPDIRVEAGIFQPGRDLGTRSCFAVPLVRDGRAIGSIFLSRFEVREFDAADIALVESFAEQAVIAIASAKTLGDLRARTGELQESLEFQTATSEVLKVISRSTFDVDPVFSAVLATAVRLCRADQATIYRFQDGEYRWAAGYSLTPAYEAIEREVRIRPGTGTLVGRAALEGRTVQILDPLVDPLYEPKEDARIGGVRTMLGVPLLRDGVPIGVFGLARRRVEPYTERQIELVSTFAAQAVIAIENTRLLTDQQEALEQQTATTEVLQVINASPGNLAPVFDAMLDKATRLCNASSGVFWIMEGDAARGMASRGFPAELTEFLRTPMRMHPDTGIGRLAAGEATVHIPDMATGEAYLAGDPMHRAAVDRAGWRTLLAVPLRRDEVFLGAFGVTRQDVRPFSDKEIALLKNFAAQAVIAMENARLLGELQARTGELMRSVAELQALEEVLRAVNSSLDLETVLATIIDLAVPLAQADEGMIYEFDTADQVFVPKAAFGMTEDRVARLRDRRIRIGETYLGRSALERAPVQIEDAQEDATAPEIRDVLQGIHAVLAVPLLREGIVVGGLVIRRRRAGAFTSATAALIQTFAAQCVLAIENARLFEDSRRARAAAEVALGDLRRAQDRLVQAEKMASLGQLTAGIAHEIKNPLNFVNNFSELSVELLDELLEMLGPHAHLRAEILDTATTLKSNLQKITEHGKRADDIVKNMLLHSRSGPVESRVVDLNAVCEEALNLAYHGARANTPGFNVTLATDFDPDAGTVEMFPQDFTRALLNLIGNGFYAAGKRAEQGGDFEPMLWLSTRDLGDQVEIRVRDNGTGIAAEVREKIFDPFFTTKPAGEGTGLGLSLTFDIVVKQHGGQLRVDSELGAFTEFTIILPRSAPGGATSGQG